MTLGVTKDPGLSEAGRAAVAEIARRHEVGTDAVLTLLDALERGGGVQAQFSHPELGGLGQWSRGGMIMVGDMFNAGLKARVDALCTAVADLVGDASLYVGGVSGRRGDAWWPEGFGTPTTAGAQNDLRYAVFPETRRLAVGRGGPAGVTHVDLYETGEHRIHGVSQQQGASQDLRFTSQLGDVALHELARVGSERAAHRDGPVEIAQGGTGWPAAYPSQSQSQSGGPQAVLRPATPTSPDVPRRDPARDASPPTPRAADSDDVFAKIERLHALQTKGILTEAEFAEKKKELLARL